jgi:hypothetical protein
MPVFKIKENGTWQDLSGTSSHTHSKKEIVDFPIATAVADATGNTPTAAEFNALLAALRRTGLMATE